MFYIPKIDQDLKFETFHTYSEVKEIWHNILPDGHPLSCPDVQALEISAPEDLEFSYVNIKRKNEIIGVMYLQCLHFKSKHYRHDIFDKPVLKHLKSYIVRQSVRLLICGNLFRVNFQGFYFTNKSEKELIFDCLQNYRDQINKGKELCGILLKDCSREFTPVQVSCHSFKPFKQDLTMELNIRPEWKLFDNYLSDLSRKYRQRALKIQNSLKEVHVKELTLDDLIKHKERLADLYMNIVKKQSLAFGILNADYFIRMKDCLGENFNVFGYFLGNQLIAFSSHIEYPKRNKMEIHYIGLDYEYNNQYNLYFNILFEGIRKAIESGYQTIEMGRTAREAKANAGAHAVENFNYIWVKPGIFSLVSRFIGTWFENTIGEEWQKRNPFKTIPDKVETPLVVQKQV